MKVSVSLPDDDVAFLDAYAKSQGSESRSAVVHKAVRLLRAAELGPSSESAWQDWSEDGEADLWVSVSNDGANSAAQRLNRGVITVVPVSSNLPKPSASTWRSDRGWSAERCRVIVTGGCSCRSDQLGERSTGDVSGVLDATRESPGVTDA